MRKVVGFFYREERGGAQGGVSFTARNAEVRKVGFNTDYAYV